MQNYAGDFKASSTINIFFTTNSAAGAAVAPSTAFEAADVILYKGSSAVQRTSQAGWTMTSPFDSVVGLHCLAIDLSDNTDAGFYAAGNDYTAVLSPDETVDSQVVVAVIGTFSIENRVLNIGKQSTTGVLPAIAAGAAGGLFIAGTNAPVTITGSGDALTITSSGGNGTALKVTGQGTGSGIIATSGSGATGNGITALAASTNGTGLQATGTGSGNGLGLTGGGTGSPNSAVVTTYTIKKNTAFTAFCFQLVLSADHVTPATGKTVTATRSLDGAAYAACANSVTELSDGTYKINLAAADLNGNMVVLKFTATGCDQTVIGIVTQT